MKKEDKKLKYDSFFVEGLEQDPFLYGLHYKNFYFYFFITLISILMLALISPIIKNIIGEIGLLIFFLFFLFFLNLLYKFLKKKNPVYSVPEKKRTIILNNKKTTSIVRGVY